MWLTYLLGRTLFSQATGMLALILLATLPLDIVYSTQLVPTVPVATCWAISLLLLVTAERELRHDSRRAGMFAVLSGVALGVSWLCNESGPLFAVALVIWTVATGSSRKLLALAAAGALAVFLAECVAFRILCGSFWWRLNIIHLEEQRVLTNLAADYYPRALFRIRQLDFSSQEGHFGLLAYLFLASFPALLWSRSRRAPRVVGVRAADHALVPIRHHDRRGTIDREMDSLPHRPPAVRVAGLQRGPAVRRQARRTPDRVGVAGRPDFDQPAERE